MRSQRGFTLIEVLIVILIISMLSAIILPIYRQTIRRAERAAIVADAHGLYTALLRYNADHGKFPAEANPPQEAWDGETLAPLTTQGYFDSATSVTSKLDNGRVLAYWAPDVNGADSEFLMIMIPDFDRNERVYIFHTGLLGGGGEWYDGVYYWSGGGLKPADDPN